MSKADIKRNTALHDVRSKITSKVMDYYFEHGSIVTEVFLNNITIQHLQIKSGNTMMFWNHILKKNFPITIRADTDVIKGGVVITSAANEEDFQ